MLPILTALEAFFEVVRRRIVACVHQLGNLVVTELFVRPLAVLRRLELVRVVNFAFLPSIGEAGGKFRPLGGLLLVFRLRFFVLVVLDQHPALLHAETRPLASGQVRFQVPVLAH